MSDFQGYLDQVTTTEVVGWALENDKEEPIEVKLWVDDAHIASADAQLFRIGVFNRKLHPNGHCGFKITVPNDFVLKEGHQIRCTIGPDNEDLINSPWTFGIENGRAQIVIPEQVKKLFFMHIAKTAGSSLNQSLSSHYDGDRVWTHLEGNRDWKPDFIIENFDFLSGHLRIKRVNEILNLTAFTKVTLLRDPVQHLASHLCWVRFIGEDSNSRFFKNHSKEVRELALDLKKIDFSKPEELKSFFGNMNEEGNNLFDNCQTRYFLSDQLQGNVGFRHVQEALSTFDHFDLIGLVENYDQFMANLADKMGWEKHQPQERLNVQSDRFGLDPNDANTYRVLLDMVTYDNVLYQEAKSAFSTH